MCRELICLSLVGILGLAHTASADLVGWWKFDDGAGSIAVDSSGNGYDGTVVDATWEAGQFGVALSFDGSAYVDVPAEAWSTIETQATVTLWAYGDPDAQPQANFILGAFQDPAVNESRVMSAHVPWSNGTVYFDTGGSTTDLLYDRINLAADVADYEGTWTHWAFVKNAETGDQQIYLNGALWHSGTGMIRPMTDVTAFTIGCKPGPTNYYVGLIDDFRLYDKALTEQELQPIVEGVDTVYPLAIGLEPANGVMIDSARPTLRWKPGDLATSHVVYFGENFDEVNAGLVEPIAVTGNSLAVGTAAPYATGLTAGQTYYWRVDAISDTHPDSPWQGTVRSFWVRPATAWDPSPADQVPYIDPNQDLTWDNGLNALFHTVYFGESFDEINDATTGGWMIVDAVYDPGPLEAGKSYYWRVDEFVGTGTRKGDLWSFTTLPEVPVTDPNLALWYTLDEARGSTAVDWSGHGNHGALEGTAGWALEGYDGGSLQLGSGGYVAVPNSDQMKLISSDSYSVALHVKLENTDQQAILLHGLGCSTWASWFLGVAGGEPDGVTVPNNFVFGVREANGGDYVSVSAPARANAWVHVAATYDGSMLRLYIDGEEMMVGAVPLPWDSGEDLHIGADPGCGGRVYSTAAIDDLRIYDRALTEDEIKEAMRIDLLVAWGPEPSRGAIVDIREATSLNWLAGDTAASHDVYLGADREAVASAGKDAPEYQGNRAVASLSLAGLVEFGGGDYYWRIDEIEADGTVHTGGLWKFTIPAYLIVEDFESYDDDMEAGTAIFQTWIDGWENSTGSTVGHLQAIGGTFGETTVVYDGGQSMPLDYNNVHSPYYSETSRTFAPALDLTASGMDTLTLYVRGQAGNDPAQLYVGLKSGATRVNVAYGDETLVQSTAWVEASIPLANFAGVNAAAVNEMFMTLGDPDAPAPGGAGLVFIDAIRTTKAEPAAE